MNDSLRDQARTVHPAQHNPEGGFVQCRFTHRQTILAEVICDNSRHAYRNSDRRLLSLIATMPPIR